MLIKYLSVKIMRCVWNYELNLAEPRGIESNLKMGGTLRDYLVR